MSIGTRTLFRMLALRVLIYMGIARQPAQLRYPFISSHEYVLCTIPFSSTVHYSSIYISASINSIPMWCLSPCKLIHYAMYNCIPRFADHVQVHSTFPFIFRATISIVRVRFSARWSLWVWRVCKMSLRYVLILTSDNYLGQYQNFKFKFIIKWAKWETSKNTLF